METVYPGKGLHRSLLTDGHTLFSGSVAYLRGFVCSGTVGHSYFDRYGACNEHFVRTWFPRVRMKALCFLNFVLMRPVIESGFRNSSS